MLATIDNVKAPKKQAWGIFLSELTIRVLCGRSGFNPRHSNKIKRTKQKNPRSDIV